VTDAAIEALSVGLNGDLLRPGDAGYDGARSLWNAMIDRKPAVILRCASTSDVVTGVRFAAEHGVLTSIRGGGHNVAGNAVVDDGLMIDLRLMNTVQIDPDTHRVRVGPGARLGDLDAVTVPLGRVVPAGIVTATGVAGLTLGGGLGWLTRKWGLTSDNLLSAEVVTADGRVVTASDEENPDLFWAIRGGGGNFGVVTSFEFQSHAFGPNAYCGLVAWPMSDARAVLEFWRGYLTTLPREVTTLMVMRLAPAAPFVPEGLHGKPIIGLVGCFAGKPEDGEAPLAPLKGFGTPAFDVLTMKPFSVHQSMFDAGQPSGGRYYWKSHNFDELSDAALDELIRAGAAIASPMSLLGMFALGGAVGDVADQDSAYPGRRSPFVLNINASWMSPAEDAQHIAWCRRSWTALEPYGTGSGYVNFAVEEGNAQVAAIYGTERYHKLAAIKRVWDPDNLFRRNHNIVPLA